MNDKVYCCIDLKSFYSSVECVELGLDPFTTNLVVADPARGRATVCLAISPAMKKLGIKNRCRVYEIPKNIKYIMAKPRMKLYMEKSAEIYSIYLKYIAPEDIHVYSVDECFIDLSDYVKIYKMTARNLAKMLIDKVKEQTGICATVGIGTNLFLAKVALDITAKNSPDFMGYLDVEEFKKTIWHHKPITDIWNIGKGIAKRLEHLGIFDLYGVSKCSERILYKEFGINAELLIDHANGIEPCTISDIHAYRSKSASISNGQILFSDYTFEDAYIILKEMVNQQVLEIVDKGFVTNSISLYIGYSNREHKGTGGSCSIGKYTNSYKYIMQHFTDLYNATTIKEMKIRKLNISLNNIIGQEFATRDLFTDYIAEGKEENLFKTVANIKRKYGKNSLLKGVSFNEKATARERNKMIGGHNSGEDE